ncbi:MAG: hypothetical protein ACYCU0_06735 [Solirubrobacteraceae bacterium]
MPTRPVAIASSAALVAVALGGCGGAGPSKARQPELQHAHGGDIAAVYQHPQRARLSLRAGASSASYTITAPSPAHYGFNVTAALPTSANVSVRIETTPGRYLSMFASRTSRESCTAHSHGSADCFGRYPLLASEPPGRWTVVVSKRSGPASTAEVAVAFVLYKPFPKPGASRD